MLALGDIVGLKTQAYAVAGLLVVTGLAAIYYSSHNGTAGSAPLATSQATSAAPTAYSRPNSSATLFSSTPYYPYSYLISSQPLSQQAKSALSGFNMTTNLLANGTSKVTIMLKGTTQSETIMLKTGYSLYIIEATLGDDGYSFDASLGDDGFVVVNQSGYVV